MSDADSFSSGPIGHVTESTDQTFMADVIEASNTQPVIVDFWAPWCGPCKTLTPIIEKAVADKAGAVKLVKINIDENPAIAGQLNVRSIPTVFGFDKGQPVDAFQGALPESQVRAWIDKLLSGTDDAKALEDALVQAAELFQAGDIGGAAQIFASVVNAKPDHVKAIAGLARCYLANDDAERARQTLDMVPEDQRTDPDVKGVYTALDLISDAPAPAPDAFAADEQALTENPKDHVARFALAEKLIGAGRNADGAEHLFKILENDLKWGDGKAREKLLQVFEAAGPMDKLTVEGRKRLSSLMFA